MHFKANFAHIILLYGKSDSMYTKCLSAYINRFPIHTIGYWLSFHLRFLYPKPNSMGLPIPNESDNGTRSSLYVHV